jgi:hypothetical protein
MENKLKHLLRIGIVLLMVIALVATGFVYIPVKITLVSATDYVGIARPQGVLFDIGAYEFDESFVIQIGKFMGISWN